MKTKKQKAQDPNIITKEDMEFARLCWINRQILKQDYDTLQRAWQIQELQKEERKKQYRQGFRKEI